MTSQIVYATCEIRCRDGKAYAPVYLVKFDAVRHGKTVKRYRWQTAWDALPPSGSFETIDGAIAQAKYCQRARSISRTPPPLEWIKNGRPVAHIVAAIDAAGRTFACLTQEARTL